MAYLVVLVVDDLEQVPAVFDAWEAVGVVGVTVLNSTGLGRLRRRAFRDDVPLMPSLRDFMQGDEHHHRTLFTVVESDELLERVLAATQEVLGDLSRPHTGMIFAMPVARAIGLSKRR